jgi:hypothetical protein
MVSAWRWLLRGIRRSPNGWMIVGGIYLIVLPPLFAVHADMAAMNVQGNTHGLLRIVISAWMSIFTSSWFWFAYGLGGAAGAALIRARAGRIAKPRE